MATYPTFMQVVKTFYVKDGEEKQIFLGTIFGLLTRIEEKVVGDNLLVQGSIPIVKRGKTINSIMGSNFPEDDNSTVWAKVQFWGKIGERFNKYNSTVDGNIRIIVSGNWKIQTYNSGKGNVTQLIISVDNFQPVNGSAESQDKIKKETSSIVPPKEDDFDHTIPTDIIFTEEENNDPYGLGFEGFFKENNEDEDMPF